MSVSAVVLAGGRSSRFGRDKLAAPIDGRPLLSRTIEALRGVATDVVVVVGPNSIVELPSGVRIARDPVAYGGPLIGVVAGLAAARHGSVVVVGGDMPWLRADVLVAMVAALEPDHEAVALEYGGHLEQLPLALRRDPAREVAEELIGSDERRLGALLEALDVARIPEPTWRAMDRDAATLRDVDTQDDLPPPD